MSAQKAIFLILWLWISMGTQAVSAQVRFTDNGDGTVTDHTLQVMWSQTDNHGDIDWKQAQRWAAYTFPLTVGNHYDGWRLPTLTELQSLALSKKEKGGYETACGQRVHIVAVIRLSCGWVWTSETSPIAPTARVFNFENNYHYTVRKAAKRAYRALAVRSLND